MTSYKWTKYTVSAKFAHLKIMLRKPDLKYNNLGTNMLKDNYYNQ